jgi:hypothetical protein
MIDGPTCTHATNGNNNDMVKVVFVAVYVRILSICIKNSYNNVVHPSLYIHQQHIISGVFNMAMLIVVTVIIISVYLYLIKDNYTLGFGILRSIGELVYMLGKVKIHGFLKKGKVWSFADLMESRVDINPNIVQIVTAEDGQVTTLGMMENEANRFANWGKDVQKLKQKNTVCLMLFNKPHFVSFWYGMSKIGVSTAMLNTNITGKPFLHSVRVSVANSDSKAVVIDDELEQTLSLEIEELSKEGVTVFVWSQLCAAASSCPATRPPRSCRNEVYENDPLIFIFTSGTTGTHGPTLLLSHRDAHWHHSLVVALMQVFPRQRRSPARAST